MSAARGLNYLECIQELLARGDGTPLHGGQGRSGQTRAPSGRFAKLGDEQHADAAPAAAAPVGERKTWTINMMPMESRHMANVLARRARLTLPAFLARLITAANIVSEGEDAAARQAKAAASPPKPDAPKVNGFAHLNDGFTHSSDAFAPSSDAFVDPMIDLRTNSLNSLSTALREARLLAEAANVAVPAELAEAALEIVALAIQESRGK